MRGAHAVSEGDFNGHFESSLGSMMWMLFDCEI